jgi:hypothetical protein
VGDEVSDVSDTGISSHASTNSPKDIDTAKEILASIERDGVIGSPFFEFLPYSNIAI